MSELKHEWTWKLPARPARVFASNLQACVHSPQPVQME